MASNGGNANYTFTTTGNSYIQRICTGNGYSNHYAFRITYYLNAIDTTNKKINVAYNTRLYSDSGYYYQSYTVNSRLYLDGSLLGSKNIGSLASAGANSAGITWSGQLNMNADGTKSVVVVANLICNSSACYPPKRASCTANITYPAMSMGNVRVYNNGTFTIAQAYVYKDATSKWVPARAHIYSGGWKECK